MYSKISSWVGNILLKNGAIEKDKLEIYVFGLQNMVSRFFGMFFLLVAGVIINAVIEAVVFFFVFMIIRKYAGGYHATTYVKCNALYLFTFVITVLTTKIIPQGAFPIILAVFAFITVMLLAPIENANNPIRKGMWKRYYIYSSLIAFLLVVATIVLSYFSINVHKLIAVTMFAAAVFMYVEIIKRRECPMMNLKKMVCAFVAKKAEKSAVSAVKEVSMDGIYQPKTPTALLK